MDANNDAINERHITKFDILLSVTPLIKLPSASLNNLLIDLTQMSDKKDHVNVFNVELFYILAPKVEKKKVRWADEPRQQSATEGTLEMLTKSPLILSCLSSLSTRKLPPEQIRVDVFVDGKIYRINEEVEMKEGNKKY